MENLLQIKLDRIQNTLSVLNKKSENFLSFLKTSKKWDIMDDYSFNFKVETNLKKSKSSMLKKILLIFHESNFSCKLNQKIK